MLVIFLPSFWLFLQFQAYLFNDYWEDIGTIKSFFDANLALTEQVSNITDPNSSHFSVKHASGSICNRN